MIEQDRQEYQRLLDMFAAAALQGLLSGDGSSGYMLEHLADGSYGIAVEMMKARAKIIGEIECIR